MSTNTQYTPGPWQQIANDGSNGANIYGQIYGQRGGAELVCKLVITEHEPAASHTLSNARLIAAAPELLAVCQTVADWPHMAGECEIVDAARAATARNLGAIAAGYYAANRPTLAQEADDVSLAVLLELRGQAGGLPAEPVGLETEVAP